MARAVKVETLDGLECGMPATGTPSVLAVAVPVGWDYLGSHVRSRLVERRQWDCSDVGKESCLGFIGQMMFEEWVLSLK